MVITSLGKIIGRIWSIFTPLVDYFTWTLCSKTHLVHNVYFRDNKQNTVNICPPQHFSPHSYRFLWISWPFLTQPPNFNKFLTFFRPWCPFYKFLTFFWPGIYPDNQTKYYCLMFCRLMRPGETVRKAGRPRVIRSVLRTLMWPPFSTTTPWPTTTTSASPTSSPTETSLGEP